MRRTIDAAELLAQLHLMSACAGGMTGPAVLRWVIRTVEEMAGKDDIENRPRCHVIVDLPAGLAEDTDEEDGHADEEKGDLNHG